jgi:hypothetical protein
MPQQKYIIPKFHDLALVVLSYGVVEITARQLTLILLSGFLAVNLWPHLGAGLPVVVRGIVAGLPGLLILPFGWFSVQGRPLEAWLFVLLRYWMTPRVYTWQSSSLRNTSAKAATTGNEQNR